MNPIIIKNNEGESLYGDLEGDSKNLVILCHGSRGSRNSKLFKYLTKNLNEKFSLFRFDFSGNGESKGKLENSTYLKDVSDLNSVVEFFISKGYSIFSIVGHSKGGSDVFLYEMKYPGKVKSLVAFAPRFNLMQSQEYILFKQNEKDFLKKGFLVYESKNGNHKITQEYIEEIDGIKNIKSNFSTKIPMIIFHGNKDEIIPVENSIEFHEKNAESRLEIIDEENHSFENSLNNELLSKKLDVWLSELLE